MISRRLLLSGLAVTVLLVLAWTGWQAWQVSRSLTAAADDARDLQRAIDAGEPGRANQALNALRTHAEEADSRTDGPTWAALTKLPWLGDDADGVRVVSSVLTDLTIDGFADLTSVAADLDGLAPSDGAIPVQRLVELQQPVTRARSAFASADGRLSAQSSEDFAPALRSPFDDLSQQVARAHDALSAAETALAVVPTMLGADGPRNYLLVFQNNAEVRATGGLPGAWARISAVDGRLSIEEQGTASAFGGERAEPILPLTEAEIDVYGPQLGEYFQDANFTPDFPRSAELWQAWMAARPDTPPIDGVLSLDPVTISYLLESTGPVDVAGTRLTAENAVEELLSRPYIEEDGDAQDAFFATAARSVFDAVTTSVESPAALLRAVARGAREGRVHVASFVPQEEQALAGTPVEGAVPGQEDSQPSVFVALNDATGSKMSYYLRHRVTVESQSCQNQTQTLLGSMSLHQSITAAEAATLPRFVTGGGNFGVDAGKQLVISRIYGPVGGEISDLHIDGQVVDANVVELDGRPVTVVVTELSGPDDVLVTWKMTSAQGQVGATSVDVTPGVLPGDKSSTVATSC